MRQKWCELVAKVCFWLLRKCGCRVPVVRPVNITPMDMQRVRAQEMITYERMVEFACTAKPDWFKDEIKRRVRETMAFKLADMCDVREETTPTGLKFTCDMLACNYPITPEP